jgi:hypothetical protein
MVGIGMGVIPLWYSTGHIWTIGRRMPMAIINIKENGMDIIKGIVVGVVLALVVKFAMADSRWIDRDGFSEYKSTDSFAQFK